MKRPELIMPAADLRRAEYAFAYGADACYGGLSKYSLRKASVDFTPETLGQTIEYAHSLGKRFYVTINIFPGNHQIDALSRDIPELAELGPDAFVASDPGIISMLSRLAPQVPIHMSTQANLMNHEAIRFWHNNGVRRVVLARELSLVEIAEIHRQLPDVELEAFVHGAMCVAYSGRCLLSNVMTGRTSNQGTCSQPCRWQYREVTLEEAKRPGEYFTASQDEHGTYFMNSSDLCLIEHLGELSEAGVSAFKVEGRNKSEYYAAVIAGAYRRAIDLLDAEEGSADSAQKLAELRAEVETTANRGFTTGFLYGDAKSGETFPLGRPIRTHEFLGVVRAELPGPESLGNAEGVAPSTAPGDSPDDGLSTAEAFIGSGPVGFYKVEVRNQIFSGAAVEIVTPEGAVPALLGTLRDAVGRIVESSSPGNSEAFTFLELPRVPIGSLLRTERE